MKNFKFSSSANGKVFRNGLYSTAILAAANSKAADSAQVPVDYTLIKNVKKPRGAKPGMVIYVQYKTVYVDPTTESKAKQQS